MRHLLFAILIILTPALAGARTWHVPVDAPTVQAGIDSAVAGDVVEVACGTYYEHDVLMKSSITLRSETGTPDCVIIDAESDSRVMHGQFLANDTVISGITFRNGGGGLSGCGILCEHSSPLIENCEFRYHKSGSNMSGAAIACAYGSTRILGCGFFDNNSFSSGGAIFCGWCDDVLISDCYFENNGSEINGAMTLHSCGAGQVDGCVFFANKITQGAWGGSVLGASSTPLIVSNCTFAASIAPNDNVGVIFCDGATLSIDRCIIANNIGIPIVTSPGNHLIECSDIFGNSGGDWVGVCSGWTEINGNYSANPCFCDLDAGDLELAADPYCLPGNHPWGCDDLVGALPAGCAAVGCSGPVDIEAKSWGVVKAMYR